MRPLKGFNLKSKILGKKIKMLHDLKIFQKTYDFLLWIKPTVERFAKVHKYSLGIQLENEAIALLKQIIRTNLERGDKKELIKECLVHHETIKIFIRLSREFNLLSKRQYEFASIELLEIGKLLGGWYKRFS